jgi:hypothetical protein
MKFPQIKIISVHNGSNSVLHEKRAIRCFFLNLFIIEKHDQQIIVEAGFKSDLFNVERMIIYSLCESAR